MENNTQTAAASHLGHRERMKTRFLQQGLEDFTEEDILEFMLFFCIPRQDTRPLARRLLAHFGSLANVFDATPEALSEVRGLGTNGAMLVNLVPQLLRYYQQNRREKSEILKTIHECGRYMLPYFRGYKQEVVFLLCLDAKCKLIGCLMAGEGTANSATVPIRRIVEMALGVNASIVLLAHNHPNGLAIPSPEDVQTTVLLADSLQVVDISLADHLIVSEEDFVSLFHSGYQFDRGIATFLR